MADITKFTVVYASVGSGGKAKVESLDPWSGSVAAVVAGHAMVGVTQTDANEDEPVIVLRSGYLRGVTTSHLTGWEPSVGAPLWCGASGKPTTTRPETGLQVYVGTYLGSGVVDVHVQMIQSIGELSYVKRTFPSESFVLIWSAIDGAYAPRQMVYADLADTWLAQEFLFMGGN